MAYFKLSRLVWALLLIEFACSRTVTHYRTSIDSDGNKSTKTWTTNEPDDSADAFNLPEEDGGYRSFVRNGVTFRVKPQTETMRLGGSNLPPAELIRQSGMVKGMDPSAVRELLETKKPVVKTSTDDQGRKRTTTYSLEPDGSIAARSVTEIDPDSLDEKYPHLFNNKPSFTPSNGDKVTNDWEWNPPPTQSRKPTTTNFDWKPSTFPRTSFDTPSDKWPNFNDDFPKTKTKTEVELPKTWNPRKWPSFDTAPSQKSPFDSDPYENPFHPTEVDTQTPGTVTKTHVDKDGRTVTTTYTVGPRKWTQGTVTHTSSGNPWPEPTTSTTTPASTPKNIPHRNLDDLLKQLYGSSTTPRTVSNTPRQRVTTTPRPSFRSTPSTKPIKTFNIEDLPAMEVLNNGRPVGGEDFLKNYPTELRPVDGSRPPIKTLKIDNIPKTSGEVETTKVKSITKTIHSNSGKLPTAGDLDPSMQDLLRKAGITPDDIKNANGDTITKTRVEPDGKIVKTTYRVRTLPPVSTPNSFNEKDVHIIPNNSPPQMLPPRHVSSSRSGVTFPTSSSQPPNNKKFLNPSHIHPVAAAPHPSPPSLHPLHHNSSPIAEFLSKLGLSFDDILATGGEYVKTIVDDDGQVLTARFTLSLPKNTQSSGNKAPTRNPLK